VVTPDCPEKDEALMVSVGTGAAFPVSTHNNADKKQTDTARTKDLGAGIQFLLFEWPSNRVSYPMAFLNWRTEKFNLKNHETPADVLLAGREHADIYSRVHPVSGSVFFRPDNAFTLRGESPDRFTGR